MENMNAVPSPPQALFMVQHGSTAHQSVDWTRLGKPEDTAPLLHEATPTNETEHLVTTKNCSADMDNYETWQGIETDCFRTDYINYTQSWAIWPNPSILILVNITSR